MTSTCLVLQQSSFVAPRFSRPLIVSSNPATSSCTSSLWRPWLSSDSRNKAGESSRSKVPCPYSRPTVPGCFSSDGKPQSFQHPVKLFWPKSKSFDYLYSDGEMLLRNFPVQATISFYEESDSEDEDEEEEDWEETCDTEDCNKQKTCFTSYN